MISNREKKEVRVRNVDMRYYEDLQEKAEKLGVRMGKRPSIGEYVYLLILKCPPCQDTFSKN